MIDLPSAATIREAAERLKPVLVPTPLLPLHDSDDNDLWLKPEIWQRVGSFKIRGVYNAVAALDPARRARGLSTVSAGNTAQALAWVGRWFGVSARSVMPDSAPATKIEAVRRYGGKPVLVPVKEVFRFLEEHLWEREPYAFIHPWTNRDLMIGHASLGLEILTEMADVDTVFVPVGGGGLIGGVGSAMRALNPHVRVVAVEPEGCPALYRSRELGRPARVACETICDGVAVPYITEEMFPILERVVDDVVLVSESRVKQTIRRLAHGNRVIVEGSGALAVAAALEMPRESRGRAVCLLTGGSIDPDKLAAILAPDRGAA